MRSTGDFYEQQACQLVLEQGLTIIATNYQKQGGEIDIIALEKKHTRFGVAIETLVCIEVKFRKANGYACAIETITPTKQKRLIKTLTAFICEHNYDTMDVRFDVIVFDQLVNKRIQSEWIQGAFLAD